MIKSTHDSWNHITGFGRRGPGFEVSFWRLAVPLYWWLSCLITMKDVELINISYKTWWEELRYTYDSGISLVSNTSTEFANTLLSHAEICNKRLKICCINVGGRWRAEMMITLTWNGQCSWIYNHFYITIESMIFSPCVYRIFYVVVKECDEICHIGRNERSEFVTIW